MDPLGQFVAAGRPNLVLGHQMPASNTLGQPLYTTVEARAKNNIRMNILKSVANENTDAKIGLPAKLYMKIGPERSH